LALKRKKTKTLSAKSASNVDRLKYIFSAVEYAVEERERESEDAECKKYNQYEQMDRLCYPVATIYLPDFNSVYFKGDESSISSDSKVQHNIIATDLFRFLLYC